MRLSHAAIKILKAFLERRPTGLSGADLMKMVGTLSGTTYPILYRLEREGLLTSHWEIGDPSSLGRPRRRLYHLTGEGAKFANIVLKDVMLPQLVPSPTIA